MDRDSPSWSTKKKILWAVLLILIFSIIIGIPVYFGIFRCGMNVTSNGGDVVVETVSPAIVARKDSAQASSKAAMESFRHY